MASADVLRQLLEPTSLPDDLVEEFLVETNALWLLGERDDVVASEMVLCHPPLEPAEVRAIVNDTDLPEAYRITVVTWDRPGLLAATAGVLANAGLTITDAAVTVLPSQRVALQRVTFLSADPSCGSAEWDRLGLHLRETLGADRPMKIDWRPSGPVVVEAHPQGAGRVMVRVEAPDSIGLLWALGRELNAQGANIEAARLTSVDGIANDVFILSQPVDLHALSAALGTVAPVPMASILGRLVTAPLSITAYGIHRLISLLTGGHRS